MLHVLHLFTESAPVWSTAAIIDALGTSRSTGYRYVKTLHDVGLLSSVRSGEYSLGPRIIEMDLQLRLTDPLLLASKGVLEELVGAVGHSANICTAFGNAVLCVSEHRAPLSPKNRFSRGLSRPLFHGSVSKVILAHFPHHRLKAVYARQANEVKDAGLGGTWGEFRAILGGIKKDGFILTRGEFNPGVASVAAPILTSQKTSLHSIGIGWDENERRDVTVDKAVAAVKEAAATISARLAESQHDSGAQDSASCI